MTGNVMTEKITFSSDEELDLEYLYNIGLSHAKRGNVRDAMFYFDKVLSVEPEHVNALAYKGNVLGKLGKYNDAITCYNKVLKINPNHQVALINKGLALHYLKKYDEAITCYDKILEKDPLNANVLYHKSCSKSLQKNSEEALTLLEQAVMIDSEYGIKAARDLDFESLRADQRFKSLTS
jgi:tetratricopeptide (TPR) repeat protein